VSPWPSNLVNKDCAYQNNNYLRSHEPYSVRYAGGSEEASQVKLALAKQPHRLKISLWSSTVRIRAGICLQICSNTEICEGKGSKMAEASQIVQNFKHRADPLRLLPAERRSRPRQIYPSPFWKAKSPQCRRNPRVGRTQSVTLVRNPRPQSCFVAVWRHWPRPALFCRPPPQFIWIFPFTDESACKISGSQRHLSQDNAS
jgi:hypothetical protein